MRLGRTLGIAALAALIGPAAAQADTYRVNELDDPAPNGCTKAHCTLREAAEAAEGTPGDDTILVPSGKRIDVGNTGGIWLRPPGRVSVKPAGRARTTIEAAVSHFNLDVNARAALSGLVLRGADGGVGGAITSGGGARLRIDNSLLTGNRGAGGAGAIYAGGSIVIRRTTIVDNEATSMGLGGAMRPATPRRS